MPFTNTVYVISKENKSKNTKKKENPSVKNNKMWGAHTVWKEIIIKKKYKKYETIVLHLYVVKACVRSCDVMTQRLSRM